MSPKTKQENSKPVKTNNGANLGYETELWKIADALRGSMDASEYKHVVLGLIFLKYISDASTQIPACLWFLARDRKNGNPSAGSGRRFRDRRAQVLFIDTRKMGSMVDRTHRDLINEDIARIANTYHSWRGEKEAGEYKDVLGFCKSVSLNCEISRPRQRSWMPLLAPI